MHTHISISNLRRAVSQQFSFPRTLFFTIIICVLLYLIYLFAGLKKWSNYKPFPVYPHWKIKTPDWKSCGVPVQNDPIIKVNNLETYMVGSYVEHRLGVKKIQTIAIVLRSEYPEYFCLLCCNGRNISVPAEYNIHSDHFEFEYGTADIFCDIPAECTEPTHVAITSQSPKGDGSLQDIKAFQPVKNQHVPKSFPYEFTVCISVMYDYDNMLQFVQAMEMFRILGVKKVAIYKTSCTEDMQAVLDYYVRKNFVEIIPWNVTSYIEVSHGWRKSVSPGELHYYGQIPALNDCVYRYMYQSQYVALQDLDELILPMKFTTWSELLPELEKKYDHNGGFEFENNYFPLSIKDLNSKYSPKSWKKVKGVNVLEHIIRISNIENEFNNFKVIVNPRLVYEATVHGFLNILNNTVRVDSRIARMYHMRSIPDEDLKRHYQKVDTHLRDYADSLIPAVSKVLRKVLNV